MAQTSHFGRAGWLSTLVLACLLVLLCAEQATSHGTASSNMTDPACPMPDNVNNNDMRMFLGSGRNSSVRSIFVSIFNNDNVNNPGCSLGLSGQSMIITRLDESASPAQCLLSTSLGLFGTKIYYSLQLSPDGGRITSIKMGCEEDCGRCYGMKTEVEFNTCLAIGGYTTGVYSISFTSASDPCFGPHSLQDTKGITAFQFIQTNETKECESVAPHCLSALVVALSVGVPDSTCHPSAIFGNTMFTFTFSDNMAKPLGYSLCVSNSTQCVNGSLANNDCDSVFTNLPLDVCRDDSVFIFPQQSVSHVRLVDTALIRTCPRAPAPFAPSDHMHLYAVIAGSVAVGLVGAALGVVWYAKTRRNAAYEPIN